MNKVHIPGNDFIPAENSKVTKVDVMSKIPNKVAYELKIVGNQNVEAGKHYFIKQINDTEAIIEVAP